MVYAQQIKTEIEIWKQPTHREPAVSTIDCFVV